jgi:hypothetical protein
LQQMLRACYPPTNHRRLVSTEDLR